MTRQCEFDDCSWPHVAHSEECLRASTRAEVLAQVMSMSTPWFRDDAEVMNQRWWEWRQDILTLIGTTPPTEEVPDESDEDLRLQFWEEAAKLGLTKLCPTCNSAPGMPCLHMGYRDGTVNRWPHKPRFVSYLPTDRLEEAMEAGWLGPPAGAKR